MSDSWRKSPRDTDRRGADRVPVSRRSRFVVGAFAAAAVLVGVFARVGSNEGPGPTSGFPAYEDACQILDDDTVREVTGMNVQRKLHDSATAPKLCLAHLGEEGGQQVNLLVTRSEGSKAFAAAGEGEPVPGVGNDAKWNDSLKVLVVLNGDDAFSLTLVGPDPTGRTLREQSIAIARQVIKRLRELPAPASTS